MSEGNLTGWGDLRPKTNRRDGKCPRCGGEKPKDKKYCAKCRAAYARLTRPKYSDLPPAEKLKNSARALANVYQERGILKPEPCALCASTDQVEKHHSDYSKPLKVTWLCSQCHKLFHMKHRGVGE